MKMEYQEFRTSVESFYNVDPDLLERCHFYDVLPIITGNNLDQSETHTRRRGKVHQMHDGGVWGY